MIVEIENIDSDFDDSEKVVAFGGGQHVERSEAFGGSLTNGFAVDRTHGRDDARVGMNLEVARRRIFRRRRTQQLEFQEFPRPDRRRI